MGKKTYFEFLEEEFQALTSELQSKLSSISAGYDSNNENNQATMYQQLTRCKAVLQQLQAESQRDLEFKERTALYKIQLEALQQHLEQRQHQ
mmetsp:Transcript_14362/g.23254  ORF Transcript_14362/g.23254 Transcript_14362/m.23254 type:complete len:92 (-) Transcript_14362:444-719(-)